ncbi:tRNA (adenosine(37)-N6)-dimethylallyltransferase MiaA [Ralstonia solanacearum]|uniref:tRNA (adenosine(37)-N6)-dimethylallyltransferase MiaA n=1 Tax=Ralstonia solanacearum TaxID=305 RepID=UPI0002F7726F|nr:tRNA (adenosine(37)-N6)-dimethylallyltransferase MiaA [Ralstonia solanacearum]MDC6178659.1 tRNA (adenosine(37)-N6)-dimethylallyltransferase MiaA [Ralstonia solanacearum]MDC6211180.1 tRNA (adenosine(37)-N6)-dimethylallyltransferase MiaA [Ralstonia solanacearum]MDC6238495.1 tRNA (adenosine(37)-N6)-dimethylallyltransferase MiaA [Ralstonia solanacearum]MDD7801713.1 tRNA (adenosine(37)-N6)-dimethylallyltransferase MiaA [Ralstonia solanacearum]TYZ53912.1 tRNA (adenosine(37)-N6)-dimethylallyltrans
MNASPPTAPRAVCLLGPTASGKTAAALELAGRWPVEIISMDSALVYRGMDIGTAKPSPAEQAIAPHHLIDIIDPLDAYSAAQFASDTHALIEAIRARGRLPLIVGGTMLYYKALTQGLSDLPGADPALRAEIDAEAARDGWPALHAKLAQIDPVTAARLHATDAQRIQRALELYRLTGQPMSALLARETGGSAFHRHEAAAPYLSIALEPSDRTVLHARIAQRFDAMLAGGLLDEVEALRRRGDLSPTLPSIRCVGYRQAWAYLDGEIDMAALREQGIAATRQLCKRQITWLRSTPERRVVDCLAPDYVDQVARLVHTALETP